MRSARTVLIISEVLTFILMTFLILFILLFIQNHLKSGYMNIQKQDISKVDRVIKSFIDRQYGMFCELEKIPYRKNSSVLLNGFSDVYYLDRNLKVVSIIKKDSISSIFRGYDFSASRPAGFFKSIHSSTPAVSGIFSSPERETLSIYIASEDSGKLLVGRVELARLTETLKWFGEFSNNIIMLATGGGYILSKTSSKIDLQILPETDFTEISLDETYMMSRGNSTAVDCSIAILTPVSAVYNLVDSLKIYYPFFILLIFTVLSLKILAEFVLFIKPVENFLSILNSWAPDSGKFPVTGLLSRIQEIKTLYETFNSKSLQIASGINELKRKEKEMHVMRNYLRSIINSMPSILVSVDPDGNVLEWNLAAQAYTGVDEFSAKGRKITEVFPELNSIKNYLDETLAGGNGFELKRVLHRERGDTFMNISAFPLFYEGAEGVVVRLDDITQLEKAERSMRQSQKMEAVGALAGGLAHDFNNILGGILGSVSILTLKTESGTDLNELRPFYTKYFGYLEDSVNRSSEIVSRLLALTKKQDAVFTDINLSDAINNVIGICAGSLDRSVEFNVLISDETAMINGDRSMLEQAILNLCINGAHSMTIMKGDDERKGGVLTVSLSGVEPDQFFLRTHPESVKGISYWSVSVKDQGIGMTGEVLSNMFDPFFTTKKKSGGTGLGLTMVYNIVQQHRGFIDVYTEAGQGSEFVIYLPRALESSKHIDFDKKDIERKGSGYILVIDDEEIIRKVVEELLILCGFKVISASNGYEGLRLYTEHMNDIRLVLLDIMMPGIGGIDTFEKIIEINSSAKVLLTSGFRDNEKIQKAIERGVRGFIQKPYTLKKLSDAVFKILDNV